MTALELMRRMAAQESDAAARIWGKEKGTPGAVPITPVPTSKELTGPPPRPLTEHKLQITRKAVSEGLGRRAIAHKLGCGEKLAMRYIAAVREES